MDYTVVEPCNACGRHVRSSEATCPFCAAPHTSIEHPPPPRAPTRAALAAWAGIFVAACGGAQQAQETNETTRSDEDQNANETTRSNGDPNEAEVSCAGRCGSHHHPPCMDDPVDPCPAPPYGAPPIADPIV